MWINKKQNTQLKKGALTKNIRIGHTKPLLN